MADENRNGESTGRAMKILAIEDNPGDQVIIRELLAGQDFEVLNAGSLAGAAGYLSRDDIGLVLLDLNLPDSNGIDTLRRFRKMSGSLPVIVLTGYDHDGTGLAALQFGAQDYLVKGRIDQATLVRSIRYASERKRIEDEILRKSDHLLRVNRQLNLLTAVTRHDIRNQVFAMLAYLTVLEENIGDPGLREKVEALESLARTIQSHIEFTRLYQDIGSQEPGWQDLSGIMPKPPASFPLQFTKELGGVAVYADPMIATVFFNLMDNSVRHGEHVTAVRVEAGQSDDGLVITFEDDGVGILAGEKEMIFERGYGKNTGLGLYLAREILAITGMTIRESGIPGQGARFEVVVPKGGYRLSPP